MKTLILSTLVCLVTCLSVQAQTTSYDPRVVRIGTDEAVEVKTPHPYNSTTNGGYVFSKTFTKDNSGYVRIHFKNFDLAPGDFVEVMNPKTGQRDIYAGGGKVIWAETRKTISDFWANPVYGETAIVRLYSKNPNTAYGFEIDEVGYGFSEDKLAEIYATMARDETVCGSNDMDEAICHSGTAMYSNARAVCRLLLNGSGLCTGWLVGSEGHVMTNNHCIGNSSTANNTTFLFDYEYSNCNGSGAQSGTVVANSSTLIKTSSTYDYALVKLPTNPTGTYGYLTMSSTPASTGDRIYIPQHPGGVRKRIAVTDDQSPYSGNVAAIRSVGSTRVAYYADTEGGSSGSPVLNYSTNRVVVLHNTGSCSSGNGGIPIGNVINDLGSLVPANGVDGSGGGGGGGSNCYEDATASATPYSESFEGGTGVWNQATCDDINWTRDSGGTPSSGTGPSTGSDGSYYMYVEASSPNYPSKSADLYASFNLAGASANELTFDYHSYGTASDVSLSVDASTDGENFTTLWSMTGNKGNQWNSVTVNLGAYAGGTVTLRFAATTGSTWQGDVAIDNVTVGGSGSGGGGGGGTVDDCSSAANQSGNTGAWNYYTLSVPANAVSTTVTTSGSNGDADLYVKWGANPTTSDYLARSISSSSNESVAVTGSGTLNIGVYAYSSYSGLTVGACNTVPEVTFVMEDGGSHAVQFDGHIASNFGIYPNPVQDRLNLHMETANNSEVVIYTLSGAVMMRTHANDLANGLDVSTLPKGMYMLSLVGTKGNVVTQRFVKE